MTSDRLPGMGEVWLLWDAYLNIPVGIFSTEERAISALAEYRRRLPIHDDQVWYWYTPYRLDSWMHGNEVIHES